MEKSAVLQKLSFLSKEEIAVISSDSSLFKSIERTLSANLSEAQKISYISKKVFAKMSFSKKETDIDKLKKLINLPKKTIGFLHKIYNSDKPLFNKLNSEITYIALDPSKDYLTKSESIKTLIRNNTRNKRKSGIKYNTYNYQQILALISEQPGINRKELQEKVGIGEVAVMDNLKKLTTKNLVVASKEGRKYVYNVSKSGQIEASELTLRFLHEKEFKEKNNSHCKNHSVHKKNEKLCSEIISETKILDKKLRNLGMHAPRVREFIEERSLEYLTEHYDRVIKTKRIKNKGAYLYTVFSNNCCNLRRIRAFAEIHLQKVVSSDVCQVFLRETARLDIATSLWLGNTLKKLARKTTVHIQNIHIALHRIYKKKSGVRNETTPANTTTTATTRQSYIDRRKIYEVIKDKITEKATIMVRAAVSERRLC